MMSLVSNAVAWRRFILVLGAAVVPFVGLGCESNGASSGASPAGTEAGKGGTGAPEAGASVGPTDAGGCRGEVLTETEPNDIRAKAIQLTACMTVRGRDSVQGSSNYDDDWFEIVVPEGFTSLTVMLKDIGAGTTSGTIFSLYKDESADLIEAAAPPASGATSFTTGVVEGDYLVLVRTGEDRQYELVVTLGTDLIELEESNDVRASAQLVESGMTYSGHDSLPGASDYDYDWFKIEVPEGTTSLTVALKDGGEGTMSGTVFNLYKDMSDMFIEASAPPVSDEASFTTGVTEGDYFVMVRTGIDRTYELTVTLGDERIELEESNDVRATAQLVKSGKTYSGYDSLPGASDYDYDWFKVEVPDGTTSLTVALKDGGDGTTSGTGFNLYKGTSDMFIEAASPAPREEASFKTGVTEGDYFIMVKTGIDRTYELTVTLGKELVELEESNDVRATAQLVESDETYAGYDSLPGASDYDYDWFKVEVPEGTTSLTVTLKDIGKGATSGTVFSVYGAAAEPLSTGTTPVSSSASVAVDVTAGDYYLLVRTGDGRAYELEVVL